MTLMESCYPPQFTCENENPEFVSFSFFVLFLINSHILYSFIIIIIIIIINSYKTNSVYHFSFFQTHTLTLSLMRTYIHTFFLFLFYSLSLYIYIYMYVCMYFFIYIFLSFSIFSDPSTDEMSFRCMRCELGVRYFGYCSSVGRTLFINATVVCGLILLYLFYYNSNFIYL